MKKYSLGSLVLCSTLAFAAVGCSSSDKTDNGTPAAGGAGGDSTGTESGSLKVLSWWSAPGEIEALQALIDDYQKHYPDVRISDSEDVTANN